MYKIEVSDQLQCMSQQKKELQKQENYILNAHPLCHYRE